jgi:phytoene synthase
MTRKTSFYYAFLVLPAPQRRAILAVFDFCRAVDDSVDLEPDQARAVDALALWRDEVSCVFGGGEPRTGQGRQLQPFVEPFQLPRAQFEALVDGVAMDAAPRRYPTFAELERYCHRVASSVGLICAAVFGARARGASDYARDLGVALQLTNILRDVGVDHGRGRCYLPLEDFDRFGCTEDDIRREVERGVARGLRSERVRALLEHQAARARAFFGQAARALPTTDARRFVAAEIMHGVYHELLRRIESAGCDVFDRLIRVPRPVQAKIAIETWWRGRHVR